MKVAIIGTNAPQQTLIEALVKAFEEKTGEQVEFVNIHSKDAEILTQKVPIKEIDPCILEPIEQFTPPPVQKTKGHKRPYKYHR